MNFLKHLWATRPDRREILIFLFLELLIVHGQRLFLPGEVSLPFVLPLFVAVAWISAAFADEDKTLDV